AAALSCDGRPRSQRLDQYLDDRPGDALQPGHVDLDRVRSADAGHRGAVRFAARARRWRHPGDPAIVPHPQDRGDDVAQRAGRAGAQDRGTVNGEVVIAGLDPAIAPCVAPDAWMRGSSPRMTRFDASIQSLMARRGTALSRG